MAVKVTLTNSNVGSLIRHLSEGLALLADIIDPERKPKR